MFIYTIRIHTRKYTQIHVADKRKTFSSKALRAKIQRQQQQSMVIPNQKKVIEFLLLHCSVLRHTQTCKWRKLLWHFCVCLCVLDCCLFVILLLLRGSHRIYSPNCVQMYAYYFANTQPTQWMTRKLIYSKLPLNIWKQCWACRKR